MALERGEKKSFKWSFEGATPEEGKWRPEKEKEEKGETGRTWRMEGGEGGRDAWKEGGKKGEKDEWKEMRGRKGGM